MGSSSCVAWPSCGSVASSNWPVSDESILSSSLLLWLDGSDQFSLLLYFEASTSTMALPSLQVEIEASSEHSASSDAFLNSFEEIAANNSFPANLEVVHSSTYLLLSCACCSNKSRWSIGVKDVDVDADGFDFSSYSCQRIFVGSMPFSN